MAGFEVKARLLRTGLRSLSNIRNIYYRKEIDLVLPIMLLKPLTGQCHLIRIRSS